MSSFSARSFSSLVSILAMLAGAMGQSSLRQFLFRRGSWQP